MRILVRRSNLYVSPLDEKALAQSAVAGADAITIDLRELVVESRKDEARHHVDYAVRSLSESGSEIFIGVCRESFDLDLTASLVPGVSGIVFPANTAMAFVSAETALAKRERDLGLDRLEILPVINSATGVWNVRSIITSSPRVRQVIFDEVAYCASICVMQQLGFDAANYARGRVILEAIAHEVQPVGSVQRLATNRGGLNQVEIQNGSRDSKNLGFKGSTCIDPAWVNSINAGFTPTEAQLEFAHRVQEAFAVGVANGTAAVQLDDRMVDVPVAKQADTLLAFADACLERDAAKGKSARH